MKNYIWDFDGTLFDTYPAMVDGAWQALKDFGISMDKKEIYFKMKKYSTSYLINESNLNAKEFNELFHRYEKESTEVSRPFPETKQVLEMLKDNGGRHFILTHRLTESTWGLLKEHRLAHLIEEVVGIDQDFPRKPNPASLNYLIDTFHLERTDTMMIGDRRLDIEAGKNAGVATCLYDIDHFLGAIPADYVVGNLNEILTLQSIIKK
ncbi:TPA: HAD-IA family hydrolase [Enterococcus faecium]|uniref:HAD family hydrolase n=1 Tax=Enterococcus faecalis TaxID=1351 RepID=A0A3N3ZCH0_ENTFL|nr:HAD-IA family hydrolase [Enterococcus faecium]ROY53736.1 HAD family hydrolase [Enterococcus faecalis]EGP5095135.1 HAD family hydrolase [Enterococcus faecium]ELA50433.1 HAD hydrolase, family IA [Enterococcus faecium EnGen0005]ELA97637.1 HAD hydrolase, family IA [Enterococcus faecium EnGen0001]EME3567863.1 HAD-IA family hydrolase [Enterococcus faecium]